MKRSASLQRHTSLKRGLGPKRKGFTPASREQKAKIEREGLRLETVIPVPAEPIDPTHIVSRALGGCDHEDCVIGLKRADHRAYDRGELDILPYLTLEEQAHAVSHLGILGALKRTTGDNYVPEREVA